jgi:hypothetical protein
MKQECWIKLPLVPIFTPVPKDVLLNHALFSEVEYNKTIPICELIVFENSKDFGWTKNKHSTKLSDQFALKLEGIQNQSTTQIVDLKMIFRCRKTLVLVNDKDIPLHQ